MAELDSAKKGCRASALLLFPTRGSNTLGLLIPGSAPADFSGLHTTLPRSPRVLPLSVSTPRPRTPAAYSLIHLADSRKEYTEKAQLMSGGRREWDVL